jgi:Protein of unknown function (DUF2917)
LDAVACGGDHSLSINSMGIIMTTNPLQDLQSSLDAQTVGTTATLMQLAKGCAVTLRPRVAGILRVSHGRAWATLDKVRDSSPEDCGDHFVAPGHDLHARAGQRVVLEAWPRAGADSITLVYEPISSTRPQRGNQRHAVVMEPLRELGQGLTLSGYALVQLARGLVGYAEYLLPGRWRGLQRL